MSKVYLSREFEGEEYLCRTCDKDITEDEIENWKCINCGDRVLIKTKDDKYLIRKLPTEVEQYESILLKGSEYYHDVLLIKKDIMEEKCSMNLKGHGKQTFRNEWINVMWNDNETVE